MCSKMMGKSCLQIEKKNKKLKPKKLKSLVKLSDLIHYLDKAEKLLNVSNNVDNNTPKD